MTEIRKPGNCAELLKKFRHEPVCGIGILVCNVCANFIKISQCIRMKRISVHVLRRCA